MALYNVNVYVTLKKNILDPQGVTIMNALHNLAYENVQNVRIGKLIEIKITADDEDVLKKQVDEFSNKLLSNPIIEDYKFVFDKI